MNCHNCRFLSDAVQFNSKDTGDQREASALRDEVCLFNQILAICIFLLYVQQSISILLKTLYGFYFILL